MPRGDKELHGGKRQGAGRPKTYNTVKVPVALTPELTNWLIQQRAALDHNTDLGKALDFLIAGLWSESLAPKD